MRLFCSNNFCFNSGPLALFVFKIPPKLMSLFLENGVAGVFADKYSTLSARASALEVSIKVSCTHFTRTFVSFGKIHYFLAFFLTAFSHLYNPSEQVFSESILKPSDATKLSGNTNTTLLKYSVTCLGKLIVFCVYVLAWRTSVTS